MKILEDILMRNLLLNRKNANNLQILKLHSNAKILMIQIYLIFIAVVKVEIKMNLKNAVNLPQLLILEQKNFFQHLIKEK